VQDEDGVSGAAALTSSSVGIRRSANWNSLQPHDPHHCGGGGAARLIPEHPQGMARLGTAVPSQFHVEAQPAPDQVRVGIGQAGTTRRPPRSMTSSAAAEVHQRLLVGADRQDRSP